MKPILDRAEKKSSSLGVGSMEKQWASLAAFVGIPLPGTGAWTGAMGAFLLGMPTAVAVSSIFTGVVSAGRNNFFILIRNCLNTTVLDKTYLKRWKKYLFQY